MALMEYSWPLLLLLALLFSAVVAFLFSSVVTRQSLPPGPPGLPFIGNPLLLGKTLGTISPIFPRLRSVYGPIITLPIAGRPSIFISDHAYAHRALVASGANFADRLPAPVPPYTGITSARYGPAWRLLRRNLAAEVLHPARVRSYADARAWALRLLFGKLASESEAAAGVKVGASFQLAMFSLFIFMCFGEKMEEEQAREVERAQRAVLLRVVQFNTFSFLPRFGKFLFRRRWKENQSIRRRQEEVFLPLIRARINKDNDRSCPCYVDSLLKLEMSEEGSRKLSEAELVVLCSEFFNAGIDTTTATFQWVMANLVKHPQIQKRVVDEIESVMKAKGDDRCLEEEDLPKMRYLRAVVMETLRRHPPVHFVLPHAVVEEVELEGYVIPKAATVNFAVAEMGRDGGVWEEPMEFRPERFLGEEEEEVVDITGTKEIKMMPFGAGRRMCPGIGLALLHLEWFVANLVWAFEWKVKDGEEVDLAEKAEAAVVMKTPLEAVIVPRKKVALQV